MRIEVFADVLCPWCYIGKRRLAAATAQIADRDEVEVVWRSYELGPAAGRVPGPTAAEAMTQWWGERAAARVAHIRAVGAEDGLELNLHLARPVNTFDAHRLIHVAAAHGVADEMAERLLRGYHTEGLNIADQDVLTRLGGEVGIALTGDAGADSVRADERRAAELGITGVPSVVIDGGPVVSGVQPPADLRRLIEDALRRTAPARSSGPPYQR
jgi:predicted DsbA family dithiol-disulfide isomerase